jgi:hypothetical protein
VVGDFFGVLVGMIAFETACTEDMGIQGIDPKCPRKWLTARISRTSLKIQCREKWLKISRRV